MTPGERPEVLWVGPRVLVVDDENGPRQALRMLLKETYDVLLAEDVPSALEVLELESIDLVITDIRMPMQSGVDLLRHVKETHPDTEVIILTGYGHLETATQAVEYDAFAYMEKPFDNDSMLRRVEGALSKRSREMERQALEQLALEANRFETLGHVVSGMIHDLGTPLSVIGSQIEMIVRSPETADGRLETMRTQVHHCTEIVRSTMNFLRTQPKHMGEVDLNLAVQASLDMVAPLLRQQRVDVRLDLSEDLARCRGDFVLIRQALLNLVTNACHAMEEQDQPAVIQVRTRQDGAKGYVSVTDTGCGIPREVRDQVFDTFYTTKDSKGTGLGLAVVKYVMRRHGRRRRR